MDFAQATVWRCCSASPIIFVHNFPCRPSFSDNGDLARHYPLHLPLSSGHYCVFPNTVSIFQVHQLALGKMAEVESQAAISENQRYRSLSQERIDRRKTEITVKKSSPKTPIQSTYKDFNPWYLYPTWDKRENPSEKAWISVAIANQLQGLQH